eukprot:763480-Hanusia_phi.AAC.1
MIFGHCQSLSHDPETQVLVNRIRISDSPMTSCPRPFSWSGTMIRGQRIIAKCCATVPGPNSEAQHCAGPLRGTGSVNPPGPIGRRAGPGRAGPCGDQTIGLIRWARRPRKGEDDRGRRGEERGGEGRWERLKGASEQRGRGQGRRIRRGRRGEKKSTSDLRKRGGNYTCSLEFHDPCLCSLGPHQVCEILWPTELTSGWLSNRVLLLVALSFAVLPADVRLSPPRAMSSKFNVVALVSGGKDSTMNMMRCEHQGHKIVALANLFPEGDEDELDSFMYQTVGHDAVESISACMQLPMYRRPIRKGRSLNVELQYEQTEGDEVEELYKLLKFVMHEHPSVNAVASGAILSNYQRIRVETVCMRLGLVSLAYLWQSDQKELLDDMIASDIEAILIKVACIGLTPGEAHPTPAALTL